MTIRNSSRSTSLNSSMMRVLIFESMDDHQSQYQSILMKESIQLRRRRKKNYVLYLPDSFQSNSTFSQMDMHISSVGRRYFSHLPLFHNEYNVHIIRIKQRGFFLYSIVENANVPSFDCLSFVAPLFKRLRAYSHVDQMRISSFPSVF